MRFARPFEGAIARAFPMPEVLSPRAAGIDISDASIKWVSLKGQKRGALEIERWGEAAVPAGAVVSGVIKDPEALQAALADVRKHLPHVRAAHAALPEEAAFIFNLRVPRNSSRAQILNVIEFELDARVPIPPGQAVYDFARLTGEEGDESDEVGVAVFPRELAESYARTFESAGLSLLSLELEARSIARAVIDGRDKDPVVLLVDFGGTRTGLAVVKQGIPIFSSTVAIGGDAITDALLKGSRLRPEMVVAWKNDRGLDTSVTDSASRQALEAISGVASSLADEIARHYRYWDTRRDERGERMSPVSKVLIVGGSANLKGLPEYISARVQAPATRPNVWQFISSFDRYVPPMDSHTALQYATGIGLALRSF